MIIPGLILGSNQVVLGGIKSPLLTIFIKCSGVRLGRVNTTLSVNCRYFSSNLFIIFSPPTKSKRSLLKLLVRFKMGLKIKSVSILMGRCFIKSGYGFTGTESEAYDNAPTCCSGEPMHAIRGNEVESDIESF